MTKDLIREAIKKVKPDKSDPVFDYSSDCLKNAPEILLEHIVTIIRCFLIHSHISTVLLLSTLVPIIKDKLGNLCISKNYRSIAISSLVLKIVDWVLILLYGENLELDDLQFAYQAECSTNMCTWLVVETIDYFLRNGGEVFACSMDMTKAFDLVVHSKLLEKLLKVGMPPIMVRLLLVMYLTQFANVRWNGTFSEIFSLKNGTKQGAVLSAILYCVYVNGLFQELRKNKTGCWVEDTFLGLLGYSDDNFVLAPSRGALQEMVVTCEQYATAHGLQFSTDPDPRKSKTRCLSFLQKEREILPVKLCDNDLPWVSNCKHLGNMIVSSSAADGGDIRSLDVKTKRARFIQRNNEIIQEFHFSHPMTLTELNKVYNSHFYGSCLWDLNSDWVLKFENTWNIALRTMLRLPRETHCYLLEPVSGQFHMRSLIASRFLSFITSIRNSKKESLRNLLRTIEYDTRSVTGRNLRKLLLQSDKHDIQSLLPQDGINEFREIPVGEEYRIEFIWNLIELRESLSSTDLSLNEIENDLSFLCIT